LPENIIRQPLEQGFQKNFIDYAMSVIMERALPDVRDGLKPVHRRILYSMLGLGLTPNSQFRKSARIVGDCLGKYHPHGDKSVYDAQVILAQDFSTRYPLVLGHGNFGSIDGDTAAAMRYTEAKLTRIGYAVMNDIDKNTVDMNPNFDETEIEPVVLPTMIPLLLANGSTGIAVGMATSIPPHNLGELYDAINYILDCALAEQEPNIDEIIRKIKAPDFPTGAIIMGLEDVIKGYKTGNGKVVIRAKYEIEESGNKTKIVVTELPYQVNKARLIERIADLIRNKIIEGISDIRDESDKDGIRVVMDLKRDANIELVTNKLLKHTDLQTSFSINMVGLIDGGPVTINIQQALESFLAHVASVIMRKTQFDLDKASKRLNIVEGILLALTNLDAVITAIREADDPVVAILAIDEGTAFNEEQAKAIADMRLRNLIKSSSEKLTAEKEELEGNIAKWNELLNDESVLLSKMKSEFADLRERFADERRTEICQSAESIEIEDLIKDEMLVVTLSSEGLIKSVEEKEYKTQGRGGKGIKVTTTKESEVVRFMTTVNSKDDILFFTNLGRCHVLKAYKIQKATRTARGKSIYNYLKLDNEKSEYIVSMLSTDLSNRDNHLLFVTMKGTIKRLPLEELSSRVSITKVIGINEGDALVAVSVVKPTDNVVITTAMGQCIRIAMNTEGNGQVRPMGRAAVGVVGVRFKEENDQVVDMTIVEESSCLLTISQAGYGKRTPFDQFPTHNRGGGGVISYNVNQKTGVLVSVLSVKEDDELFIATSQGQIVRVNVSEVSIQGRSASGVKVMNLNEGDYIVSVSKGAEIQEAV
jgi:DNA gyrase subunit A